MRRILLIDGENFFHSLVNVLQLQKQIRDRRSLQRIAILELLRPIPRGETRYYATTIQLPSKASKLYQTVERMRQWNARWAPYLANQGINFVRAGTLKVRDSKRCQNCGKKTAVLLEKGVDVRLAVDMMAEAGKGITLYLFSSDSDLLPAVSDARKAGATVVYVAFEPAVNNALKHAASKTIIIPNSTVVDAYKKANQ
jgi:uncharacterized LabA/DUF88 family protein